MLNRALLPAIAALALAGCVNLGAKPPPQLLTLTAAQTAPAGTAATGQAATALAVLEPNADQRLAVTRVPVQVNDSAVAYLQDAVWVDKPARLFQRLLAETIRAKGGRLVVDQGDLGYAAATKLSGQLLDMGYDVASASVVVRFDGLLQTADGQVRTKRFESRIPGVAADALSVGSALNQASNQVAAEVAAWVG
jgi:cholesterol transport system auxiliary component